MQPAKTLIQTLKKIVSLITAQFIQNKKDNAGTVAMQVSSVSHQ